MSKFCSCIETFLAPQLPCIRSPCDFRNVCDDLLNASVQAIITARNPGGLTADEILNEIMVICDVSNVDEHELNNALTTGARRGVLKRTFRNGLPAFMVNGRMNSVNPLNKEFVRCLCEFYVERGFGGRRPRNAPNCKPCAIPISTDGISDTRSILQPCSTCPQGCFSNSF